MRRADGDREVGVARIIDRQSHSRARRADCRLERAVAGVAGGDHHDDAGFHQAIDLDAERALPAREPLRLEVISEAHVHPVDEQPPSLAVDLLHVVDGGDEIAHGAFSIFIEHAEANELASWRHPADTIELASVGIQCRRCLFLSNAKLPKVAGFPSARPTGTRHSPAMMPATCVPWPFLSSKGPAPSTVKSLCQTDAGSMFAVFLESADDPSGFQNPSLPK